MLVAGDVHTKGWKMFSTGADIDMVKGSVAWELPEEPQNSVYLQLISQLVANSDGLLAPINGSERVMSTDASHAAAFL